MAISTAVELRKLIQERVQCFDIDEVLYAWRHARDLNKLSKREDTEDYSNLSQLEYSILLARQDSTWYYSDSPANYDAGESYSKFLKEVRKLNPDLKPDTLKTPNRKARLILDALLTGGWEAFDKLDVEGV
jgi:hypothetical protein